MIAEPEFTEHTQRRSKLPALLKWPSRRKANKNRPRTASRDGPAPKKKCFTRSKVGNIFISVLKTAPVAESLFDMLLDEILSDVEWKPTIVELLTPAVSLVVGDLGKDLEREDPVEPVPDVEQ